jgi:hypothetical protein
MDKQQELFGATVADGFTTLEYAERYKLQLTTAREQLGRMLRAGKIEYIGYRAGRGRLKVYRIKAVSKRA